MAHEKFAPTEDWPMQEVYKRGLHERIQKWGERVAPYLQTLPADQRQPREEFFEFLVTSVERGDRRTAETVQAINESVRSYIEGPGPYGRGGGSIDSTVGIAMCQNRFEGLFGIFEAGQQSH